MSGLIHCHLKLTRGLKFLPDQKGGFQETAYPKSKAEWVLGLENGLGLGLGVKGGLEFS